MGFSGQAVKKKKNYFTRLARDVKKNPGMYLLSLPAFVLIILFAYVPMYGVLMAFQDYSMVGGIFFSDFIGFENFKIFFNSFYFWDVMWNTFSISLFSIAVGFTLPIIFALVLNSSRLRLFKKSVQMISYAPYFISTIVVVSMLTSFFNSESGILFRLFDALGLNTDFTSNPKVFKTIFILSGVWQSLGWSSIIYLSVLAGVSPELYDAAKIDGANKFKVLRHIEFPELIPTISMLFILALGGILSVGFEKIYLMQSSLNGSASEVISTYVYKLGILNQDYGLGTAVGLFNSLINFVILALVNFLARTFTEYSIW